MRTTDRTKQKGGSEGSVRTARAFWRRRPSRECWRSQTPGLAVRHRQWERGQMQQLPIPSSVFQDEAAMADLIAYCAIVLAALSPILRRVYIEYFWAHGRGTVIQIDRTFVSNDDAPGWVWVPTIEYHVAGRRWASSKSYWQRPGGFFGGPDSKYSIGDEVEIFYNPRKPWRFTLKGWSHWIAGAM